MANEIFSRTGTNLQGAFSADTGSLSFGSGISTALVQNFSGQYSQMISRLYEVGNQGPAGNGGRPTANIYYVGGRSQGQLSIARVIGPVSVMAAYYTRFGDVCNAAGNMMDVTFRPGCSATIAVTYGVRYCVINQIGFSITAQDMVVNESSSLIFTGMSYTGP